MNVANILFDAMKYFVLISAIRVAVRNTPNTWFWDMLHVGMGCLIAAYIKGKLAKKGGSE